MDEEQTAGYREVCGQCGAINWGVSNEDRFYCKSCHNVIARTREVVDTSTMFLGSSRVSSVSKGIRNKTIEQGREWLVCEGFQFILKHQAEALLAMGVCPEFKDKVLCQFWRRYLQKSRHAYTTNLIRRSSQGSRVVGSGSESPAVSDSLMSASETDWSGASDTDGVGASNTDGGGASDTDGGGASAAGSVSGQTSDGRASSVISGSRDGACYLTPGQRRNQKMMTMPKTLVLCHLALLWAREAVTLADLLRLVSEGHIPYVNAHEIFPEEMKLHGRDTILFRVESIPSHRQLHKESQVMAVFLELPAFPPITPDCLLHPSLLTMRLLTEANLPDELHGWVCQIIEKAGMESDLTFEPKRSKSALPLYDVQAAALIIIAMKLLFRLNDLTEWVLSTNAEDKNQESADGNNFSLRTWYQTVQSALTKAQQRQQDNIARKSWKPQKPLYPLWKKRAVHHKRRRTAEQLQFSFQKLSGGPAAPDPTPARSYCFRWAEEGDGPSLHHHTLDSIVCRRGASLQPLNQKYWHPALRVCKPRFCGSHYAEMEATLPRMYVWLLDLFSFILGVKPAHVYEEVLKVERRFLRSSKPQGNSQKGAGLKTAR